MKKLLLTLIINIVSYSWDIIPNRPEIGYLNSDVYSEQTSTDNTSKLTLMWELDHDSDRKVEDDVSLLYSLIVDVPEEFLFIDSYTIRVKVDNLTFYRSIECEGNNKYQYIVITPYLGIAMKRAKTMQIIFDNYIDKKIMKEFIIEGFQEVYFDIDN